jgi:cytochrome c553
MLSPKVVTLGAALALALASCAPRAAAPTATRWADMTREQRHAYMEGAVMPATKQLFATFDHGRYARMTCATCHGKDGEARRWRMPNPDLLLEIEAVNAPGDVNDFMRSKLTPEMARLLGRPSFDCYGCHTLDR